MLPISNRLKKRQDIGRVFKEGKGFKEDFLILKLTRNNLKNLRFAFIVSTKISKKAPIRNKIRRRMSEVVRLKLEKENKLSSDKKITRGGSDIIFKAAPGLENKDFWEIEDIINKLFEKAEIFKE